MRASHAGPKLPLLAWPEPLQPMRSSSLPRGNHVPRTTFSSIVCTRRFKDFEKTRLLPVACQRMREADRRGAIDCIEHPVQCTGVGRPPADPQSPLMSSSIDLLGRIPLTPFPLGMPGLRRSNLPPCDPHAHMGLSLIGDSVLVERQTSGQLCCSSSHQCVS